MGRRNRKKNNAQKKVLTNTQKSILDPAGEAQREIFQNQGEAIITNGLQEALGLPTGLGAGTQLSQADTLFKNNRWYLVSNMRQLLSEIYVEIGLVKTIVDIPVEDGLRGGINIKTDQLEEDQIQDLHARMEQQGDIATSGQAMKWNRLFGGGAIIVITGQDATKPLDWGALEDDPIDFRAIDMWELYYSKQNTEDYASSMNNDVNVEFYDYYGMQVHKSRVFLVKGLEAPSFVRPKLRGWGVSVVETLVRSINQYLKATDLTFEVLDEFKLDIFKIKGLTTALHTKEGHEVVRKRVALANQQKNYQNAITMDGEDDYIQKQLSFAGLSDAMTGIRMQVASDMRMPLTKLFGISSAGFSSGEDDIENYNATIESDVRAKAKPILLSVVKLRCQQMFGFIPDDLTIEFNSLRVLSSEQEENVKSATFGRVLQARSAGEISRLEFREMINHDDLLPMRLETDGIDAKIPEPILGGADSGAAPKGTPSATTGPLAKNSYIDSPINFKGKRVVVVGVMSGDEVLRGKRRDNKKWTCPAGHLEKDELEKDGAVREVFEESGIRLMPSDLKEICSKIIHPVDGSAPFALFGYVANIPKQEATAKNDPDKEVSEWRWVDKTRGFPVELDYDASHAGLNDIVIMHLREGLPGETKKRRNYLPNFGFNKKLKK